MVEKKWLLLDLPWFIYASIFCSHSREKVGGREGGSCSWERGYGGRAVGLGVGSGG